ncbi:MAG: hypothetical protein Hens3KO_12520 [Henriciella sp.]
MSTADTLEQRALALLSEALEQASSERLAWVKANTNGDTDLIDRVTALLGADSSARTALRTGGANHDIGDVPAPERAGPYRITDLVGRGGMGAVYKGERDTGDFEQTAAIKIIRPGVLSDSLIGRFERERQILADLSHPNIARLFDGGSLADGSPYLVMEYVDGQPIVEWADNANLGLSDRLWLFGDACTAVRYAHQNLIVHRDITPSNILVTQAGTVKLIDFGIAKPQSNEVAQGAEDQPVSKSLASLSFTPGYGAPERAQGAPANTLSDIYSLGKLLETLTQGLATNNADVAAIIKKAAALDPVDRYASVDALIDDLTNLRSNYPVEARGGGAGYHFSKFVSRNKIAITAGTLGVLGLIGALIITQSQYNRAESALVQANARFEQARGLSNTMITDVYDAIQHIPGTLEARQNLAGIVTEYVDELAADPYAPNDVLMDVAVQNTRLSDLYGGLGVANFGDTETSFELLLRAEDALTRLLSKTPNDVRAIDEMIWVKRLKSNQQLTYQLDVDAARITNEEGLSLAERGLTLPGAEDTKLYFRLWNSRTDRVKILMYENNYDAAILEAARYRAELAASEYEEDPQRRKSRLAYFASLEGEALADQQRWPEAIAPLESAISAYDEILAVDASSYYYNLQKMATLGSLVMSYMQLENASDALRTGQEAVRISEILRDGDPQDASGRGYVATQLEMLARVEARFGEPQKALTTITEALDIRRGVITDFPETPAHKRDFAGTLKAAGYVYNDIGRTADACQALQDSLAELETLSTTEVLTDIERDVWIPEIKANKTAYGCSG